MDGGIDILSSFEPSKNGGKKVEFTDLSRDTIMGTSKNGAVLKLRSGVGVLLRRGGGYSDHGDTWAADFPPHPYVTHNHSQYS